MVPELVKTRNKPHVTGFKKRRKRKQEEEILKKERINF